MVAKDEILLKKTLVEVQTQMRRHNVEGYNSAVNFLLKDAIRLLEWVSLELPHNKGNWQTVKAKLKLLQSCLVSLERIRIEVA